MKVGSGPICIIILTCLSSLTFKVSRLNLNSWLDLCNQTVNIIIFKVSSSHSEYFNQKFEVLTEISMSNLECKCTQACKIFHAYRPWIHSNAWWHGRIMNPTVYPTRTNVLKLLDHEGPTRVFMMLFVNITLLSSLCCREFSQTTFDEEDGYVVRVMGLPWSASHEEILSFFEGKTQSYK